MRQDRFNKAIAYYYAMGRMDQVDVHADSFLVATDFSNRFAANYEWDRSVYGMWEQYSTELQSLVHVDLGVSYSEDNDEPAGDPAWPYENS